MRFLSRSGWAAALAACSFGAALAAQNQRSRVLELEYRIQDLAGRIQGLDIRESETEIRIEMAADVLFDFDKADIKREATPALEKVAAVLAGQPQARVSIEGYTDGKGSADYNQQLSLRRASSVARWLAARKELEALGFTPRGFGVTKPVAPNTKPDGSDDPDGRRKNRRVEIVVKKA